MINMRRFVFLAIGVWLTLATVLVYGGGSVISSPGKVGAALEMDYTLGTTPEVGNDLSIDLVFSSRTQGAQQLTVAIHADDGLTIVSGDTAVTHHLQGTTIVPQQSLVVQPQTQGLFYVNVITRMVSNGQTRSRSFAVPVQVGGEVALKQSLQQNTPGRLSTDAEGNPIISMPAQRLVD